MNEKKASTIEEFIKEVRACFHQCYPKLNDADIDRYFATEEAQYVIKDAFQNGSSSSAASCLFMMYEG